MNEVRFADTTRFVHETIDDETVLLDAVRGHLFLFTGLGSWLWHRMQRGATVDDAVGEVSARFGAEAAGPTRRFLEALVDAEMLPTERSAQIPMTEMPYPERFEAPALEKYDDIADIVAIDQIHDVDPAKGWPRRMESDDPKP